MERLNGRLAGALIVAFSALMLLPGYAAPSAAARRAAAQGPQCPSAGIRTIVLNNVVSGSGFKTADGMEVRLAGVLAAGEGGEPLNPSLAAAARAGLASALQTGPLTLAGIGAQDRYGRVPAQIFANGTWVQGALLRAGELRVAPDPAGQRCAKLLLAAEAEARAGQAGHWGDGLFSSHTPEQIQNSAGSFEIVEGTVRNAEVFKGRAYIEFRGNTDFKATISAADLKGFRQARFNFRRLSGQRVRLRGWMISDKGPEMEIVTPAAIEFITCARGTAVRC